MKIFGDHTLDEITNSRLLRLKQHTLPWRFDIVSCLARATMPLMQLQDILPFRALRNLSLGSPSIPEAIESALMASIHDDAHGHRVVVPPSLRERVLRHLHAAHQGTPAMEQHARAIVFWPGMLKDQVQTTRYGCSDCNRNAQSQAATPPLPSSPPSTPFEAVFADDFLDNGGCHYLVVGDRLPGWVEVLCPTAGSDLASSAGLVHHLRTFFATFGVPEDAVAFRQQTRKVLEPTYRAALAPGMGGEGGGLNKEDERRRFVKQNHLGAHPGKLFTFQKRPSR